MLKQFQHLVFELMNGEYETLKSIQGDKVEQGRRFTMPAEVERLIGARIAALRKERNLTQARLAESIDVTTETISRLERGVSMPSLKTLERISNVMDVPLKGPL